MALQTNLSTPLPLHLDNWRNIAITLIDRFGILDLPVPDYF
jgi:hypothetical protein